MFKVNGRGKLHDSGPKGVEVNVRCTPGVCMVCMLVYSAQHCIWEKGESVHD